MTRIRSSTWGLLFALCVACSGNETRPGGDLVAPPPAAGTGAGTTESAAGTGPSGAVATAGGTAGAAVGGSAGTSGRAAPGTAGTSAPPRNDMDAGAMPSDAGMPMDAGAMPSDAGDAATTPPPPRGTGPGDWVAGDYPAGAQTFRDITGVPGQGTRQYKVHVPPSYDPMKPMPVVFCIHGLGMTGVTFCVDGTMLNAKADSAGFILVMPNGTGNSWNGGTCCGDAVSQKLPDVALMRAIFADISKHLNIDTGRVYATGLSNGGYMSYRLACEAADLFTAVAPAAGAIGMSDIGGGTSGGGDFTACKPSAKVAVLDLHGTEDPLIPYSTQKPSLERLAMANGCKLTTHPATQPKSGGDTTCVTYDDCPPGGEITACSVKGGGHVWFGSPNCGTGVESACAIVGANSDTLKNTDVVWEFFSRQSR